jgi:hypothetical protein
MLEYISSSRIQTIVEDYHLLSIEDCDLTSIEDYHLVIVEDCDLATVEDYHLNVVEVYLYYLILL